MNMTDRIQDIIDGLCLVCLGGMFAALALSPDYWYFLNPKFSMLTATCGGIVALCGLVLVLRPRPGKATVARLLRQAVFLVFLCLLTYAWDQAASAPVPGALSAPDQQGEKPMADAPPEAPPIVEKNGVQYTRLNLAELYIMVDKGRTDYPKHFAMRVQVVREPKLQKLGQVLIERIAVVCCLADSMRLCFVTPSPDGVQSGDWVEVFGHLEPIEATDALGNAAVKAASQGEGASLKIVNPKFRVVPDSVVPIEAPGFPYVFEFHEKPPFAW